MNDEEIYKMHKEFSEFCIAFALKYEEYFKGKYDLMPGMVSAAKAGSDLSQIFDLIRWGMEVKQNMFSYKISENPELERTKDLDNIVKHMQTEDISRKKEKPTNLDRGIKVYITSEELEFLKNNYTGFLEAQYYPDHWKEIAVPNELGKFLMFRLTSKD